MIAMEEKFLKRQEVVEITGPKPLDNISADAEGSVPSSGKGGL